MQVRSRHPTKPRDPLSPAWALLYNHHNSVRVECSRSEVSRRLSSQLPSVSVVATSHASVLSSNSNCCFLLSKHTLLQKNNVMWTQAPTQTFYCRRQPL